jgi:hypothetical protein
MPAAEWDIKFIQAVHDILEDKFEQEIKEGKMIESKGEVCCFALLGGAAAGAVADTKHLKLCSSSLKLIIFRTSSFRGPCQRRRLQPELARLLSLQASPQ